MNLLTRRLKVMRGAVRIPVLLALLAGALVPMWLWADAPAWWAQCGVLNTAPGVMVDDYAAVNQGQVKNIAASAIIEFNARLPEGAGPDLLALGVNLHSVSLLTDDFLAINQGQLKTIAAPFYWRLMEFGLVDKLPWTATAGDDDSYALANIGQVKNLFSFSVPDITYNSTDPVSDPEPDAPPAPPPAPPRAILPDSPSLWLDNRDGDIVQLRWAFSATTSDNESITQLKLYRDGVLLASPAVEGEPTASDDGAALHGSVTYTLRAVDARSRVSPSSNPIVVVFNPTVLVSSGYRYGSYDYGWWWGYGNWWNYDYWWNDWYYGGYNNNQSEIWQSGFEAQFCSLTATRWKSGFDALLAPSDSLAPLPIYKQRIYATTYAYESSYSSSGDTWTGGYYNSLWGSYAGQDYIATRRYAADENRWYDDYTGTDSGGSDSYSDWFEYEQNGFSESHDSHQGTWSLRLYEGSSTEGSAHFDGTASGWSSDSDRGGDSWGPSAYYASIYGFADIWDDPTDVRRHGTSNHNHPADNGSATETSSITEILSQPYTTTELREVTQADITALGDFPEEWGYGKSSYDKQISPAPIGVTSYAAYTLNYRERQASLTRVTYRVRSYNYGHVHGTFKFRWREVFYPQVQPPLLAQPPEVLAERTAEIVSGDEYPSTESFILEPPTRPGRIEVISFNPSIEITRLLPAAPPPTDSTAPLQPPPAISTVRVADRSIPLENLRSVSINFGTNATFDPANVDRITAVTLAATAGADHLQLIGIRSSALYDSFYNSTPVEISGDDVWSIQPGDNLVDQLLKPDAPRHDFVLFAVGMTPGATTTQLTLTSTGAATGQATATAPTTTVAPALTVDVNRDGKIDIVDAALISAGHVPRFWFNDDDGNPAQGKELDADGDIPDGHRPDYDEPGVDGMRDLIDLLPVQLDLGSALSALPEADRRKLRLTLRSLAFNLVDPVDLASGPLLLLSPNGTGNPTRPAYLTDTTLAARVATAPTRNLTGIGYILSPDFVEQILAGQSVILVEARPGSTATITSPGEEKLELWVEGPGTPAMMLASLKVRLSTVEQMYERKSILDANYTEAATAATNALECFVQTQQDRHFVWVHGYNVNPQQARGWQSQAFKRLYWSGMQAQFHAVTWGGSESQVAGAFSPNYHINVVNAFRAAPRLRDYINSLSGEKVIAAHSLGNMVVSSAISDGNGMQVDRYLMLDAAVATEYYAGENDQPIVPSMAHSDWCFASGALAYGTNGAADDLAHSAAMWYKLWATTPTDSRYLLTWRLRFPKLNWSGVYNFYSPGDEVFTPTNGPTPGALGVVWEEVQAVFLSSPAGVSAWSYQEKLKGRNLGNAFLGSNYGGWGKSSNPPWGVKVTTGTHREEQVQIVAPLPDDFSATLDRIGHLPSYNTTIKLAALFQQKPFFLQQLSDPSQQLSGSVEALNNVTNFGALFDPATGAEVAQKHRSQLLADAIPVVTNAVGHETLHVIDPDHNIDLQQYGRPLGVWPQERGNIISGFSNKWLHSDLKNVPYLYNYKGYDLIVAKGNLK